MHINYLKNYLLGAEIKAINFPTISICDSMIVDVNNHEDIYWLEICKNDKKLLVFVHFGEFRGVPGRLEILESTVESMLESLKRIVEGSFTSKDW